MGQYLGRLSSGDPLFQYLKYDIFPQLGADGRAGVRVFRNNASNAVYVYEDRASGQKVIGKFFCSGGGDRAAAFRHLEREYNNLHVVRQFISHPHYVARPLGRNDDLNCLLVVEYCHGEPLDSIIRRSIVNNERELLFRKLTALAYFLASMHNCSARGEAMDFAQNCDYMDMLVNSLAHASLIGGDEVNELRYWYGFWRDRSEMWQDNRVFVHGDVTPSNFLFGDDLYVISFDLERGHYTDRVFDVGRLAAELFHSFLRATGDKYAAEPFIGHFLWEYACHFPDRDAAFRSISARVPFYMGVTLLRIARNGYLDWGYRQQLIAEAKQCLRRR